jgi:hypothetical protein
MRGKNGDRVTNAHGDDFEKRNHFDEEVDADFVKCFG